MTLWLNEVSAGINRAGTRSQQDIQGDFTSGAAAKIRREYPAYSVLIYHNRESAVCVAKPYIWVHYELPLSDWFATTTGYEVFVLTNGWFTLEGDGGFNNWSYGGPTGKVVTQGNHVVFGSGATCS